MSTVAGLVEFLLAARNGVFEQMRQAAADVLTHVGFCQWRQPMGRANVIHARRNRRETVYQGTVEIEEDCTEGC